LQEQIQAQEQDPEAGQQAGAGKMIIAYFVVLLLLSAPAPDRCP